MCIGVPEEVIKRAASVLDVLGNNKHIERVCTGEISAQDQQYKVIYFQDLGFVTFVEKNIVFVVYMISFYNV